MWEFGRKTTKTKTKKQTYRNNKTPTEANKNHTEVTKIKQKSPESNRSRKHPTEIKKIQQKSQKTNRNHKNPTEITKIQQKS